MIRGQIIIIAVVFSFVAGVGVCAAVYSAWICPDTNKAVVKQIKKDNIIAAELVIEAKKQKAKDATFNQAVDDLLDTTGCSTVHDDALYNLLLDPQYN